MSKSAITPSFNGRIAWMWPGVRPIIRFASVPTASGPAVLGVDRDDRRLVEHDAPARARTPGCWRCRGRPPCRGRRSTSTRVRTRSEPRTGGPEADQAYGSQGRVQPGDGLPRSTVNAAHAEVGEEQRDLPRGRLGPVGAVHEVLGASRARGRRGSCPARPRAGWSRPSACARPARCPGPPPTIATSGPG